MKKIADWILNQVLHRNIGQEKLAQIIQFVQFGMVGVSNSLIAYAVYAVLVLLDTNYLVANIAGFCISVINAFYWNNKYVFKQAETEERCLWKSFLKTVMAYAGTGLILSNILLVMWVSLLHINEMLAPIVNLCITVPLNYLLNKLWAFRKR